MKPPPFRYAAPTTIADAVGLLAEWGDDARLLAGGQSLLPMLALRLARFDVLVDLGAVERLQVVTVDGAHLHLGAMVRQRVVERHPLVGQHAPLLARASRLIGHVPVRHRGTLGGSLAHADPAAEYPAAVVALGGELTLTGPSGSRVVPADGFFTGLWSTALEPGEIVVDVTVPLAGPGSGFAVREISRRPGDFALAGAAVAVAVDAARAIRVVRVACFGVSDRPALVVPDGLVGTTAGRIDTAAVGRAVAAAITAADDKDHALPAWYRSRLVAQVVAAALEQALAEAVQSAAAKGR